MGTLGKVLVGGLIVVLTVFLCELARSATHGLLNDTLGTTLDGFFEYHSTANFWIPNYILGALSAWLALVFATSDYRLPHPAFLGAMTVWLVRYPNILSGHIFRYSIFDLAFFTLGTFFFFGTVGRRESRR